MICKGGAAYNLIRAPCTVHKIHTWLMWFLDRALGGVASPWEGGDSPLQKKKVVMLKFNTFTNYNVKDFQRTFTIKYIITKHCENFKCVANSD